MIDVNIHSVRGVKATVHRGETTSWIDLRLVNTRGQIGAIAIFMPDHVYAKALAEAINSIPIPAPVSVALEEVGL